MLSDENNEKQKLLDIDRKTFFTYFNTLLFLSIPNIVTSLTWVIQGTSAIYFLGQLNNVVYLDAFSLSNTWCSIFGYSFVFGLATGLDTLVSQSFGRQEYSLCGLHLFRAFIVVGITSIPCYLVIYISGPLFNYIGMDKEVSYYAHISSIALIPAVMLSIPMVLLEKFLQAQRIVKPQMKIQLVNSILNPLYCYFCVFTLNMGYLGAPAARCISQLVYILGMIFYMKWSGCCNKTLIMPTKEVFKGWFNYLRIAVPTMLMMCLEWWSTSVMTLISGKIGVVELAAYAIAINWSAIIFRSSVGIGAATGTLVGNCIGEKNIESAKKYAFMGIILSIISTILISTPAVFIRHKLASWFTHDEKVIEILDILIFIVVIMEIFDGIQGTLARALIGMGRQKSATYINLVSYYLFMIPFAFIAVYWLNSGIYGIWIDFLFSALFVAIGFIYLIWTTDWEKLIEEAEERSKAEHAIKEKRKDTNEV